MKYYAVHKGHKTGIFYLGKNVKKMYLNINMQNINHLKLNQMLNIL